MTNFHDCCNPKKRSFLFGYQLPIYIASEQSILAPLAVPAETRGLNLSPGGSRDSLRGWQARVRRRHNLLGSFFYNEDTPGVVDGVYPSDYLELGLDAERDPVPQIAKGALQAQLVEDLVGNGSGQGAGKEAHLSLATSRYISYS